VTSNVSWNWKVKLKGISWQVSLIDEFRNIRSVVAVENNQALSQNLPVSCVMHGKFYEYFCFVRFCYIETEALLRADKTHTEFCHLYKND